MSLVGSGASPHALRAGDKIIWNQKDGVCTVLVVKDVQKLKVEHGLPFYKASYAGGGDADFTHVVIEFKGLPWPCIFGPGIHLEQYHDSWGSDD